jgi:hypothetical protein
MISGNSRLATASSMNDEVEAPTAPTQSRDRANTPQATSSEEDDEEPGDDEEDAHAPEDDAPSDQHVHKRRKTRSTSRAASEAGSSVASSSALPPLPPLPSANPAASSAKAAALAALQSEAITLSKSLGLWCHDVALLPPNASTALTSKRAPKRGRTKRRRNTRDADPEATEDLETKYAYLPVNPYQLHVALG